MFSTFYFNSFWVILDPNIKSFWPSFGRLGPGKPMDSLFIKKNVHAGSYLHIRIEFDFFIRVGHVDLIIVL